MQSNANFNLDLRDFEVDVLANSPVFASHFLNLMVELTLEPGQLLQTHITEIKKLENSTIEEGAEMQQEQSGEDDKWQR